MKNEEWAPPGLPKGEEKKCFLRTSYAYCVQRGTEEQRQDCRCTKDYHQVMMFGTALQTPLLRHSPIPFFRCIKGSGISSPPPLACQGNVLCCANIMFLLHNSKFQGRYFLVTVLRMRFLWENREPALSDYLALPSAEWLRPKAPPGLSKGEEKKEQRPHPASPKGRRIKYERSNQIKG